MQTSLFSTQTVQALQADAEQRKGRVRRRLDRSRRRAKAALKYLRGSFDRDVAALRRATTEMERSLGQLAAAKTRAAELRAEVAAARAELAEVLRACGEAFDANDLAALDSLEADERRLNDAIVDLQTASRGVEDTVHRLEGEFKEARSRHDRLRLKVELKEAQRIPASLQPRSAGRHPAVAFVLVLVILGAS